MEPQNPSLTLLGAAVALIGVGEIAGVDDRVNRIFRVVTVFAFLGTAAAYRRSQRRPGVDPFPSHHYPLELRGLRGRGGDRGCHGPTIGRMRTLLGFVVAMALFVAIGYTVGVDHLGDWGITGVSVALGLLMTLFDREAFYGPRPDKPV